MNLKKYAKIRKFFFPPSDANRAEAAQRRNFSSPPTRHLHEMKNFQRKLSTW